MAVTNGLRQGRMVRTVIGQGGAMPDGNDGHTDNNLPRRGSYVCRRGASALAPGH